MLNFNPITKEEVHKLETALLIGTLFRKEVLDEIRNSSERLTWVDSLAVASGALARSKAGMSISEIADELGRSEASIREHIKGSSKAGKLVLETYDLLKDGKLNIENMLIQDDKMNRLKEKLYEMKKIMEEVIDLL